MIHKAKKKASDYTMTIGQATFWSGIGLLVFTILLCVFFWLKKPKYIPENITYENTETGRTQRLQNGYPTERETIRREMPIDPLSPTWLEETEKLDRKTAAIFQTEEAGFLPPTEKIDP